MFYTNIILFSQLLLIYFILFLANIITDFFLIIMQIFFFFASNQSFFAHFICLIINQRAYQKPKSNIWRQNEWELFRFDEHCEN